MRTTVLRPAVLRTAAVLALAGVAAAARSRSTTEGPPPGYTGGFGEPSCVSCHVGNDVNAFGGRAYVSGLPRAYEPGERYLLSVVLEAEETSVAGFQVTARYAGGPDRGRNAGTLAAVDERATVSDSAGISYLHQSRAGSVAARSDGASWSVAWVAPRSEQPVALHLAANSGNADDSPLGDLVYTHEAVLPAAADGAAAETALEAERTIEAARWPAPDSARLLRDLAALAHDSMEGRGTGSAGAAKARAFAVRELRAAGVEPIGGSWERPFEWGDDGRRGVNVVGRVPGTGGTAEAGGSGRAGGAAEAGGTGATAGSGGAGEARGLRVAPADDAEPTMIVLTAHYDHLGIRDGEIFNGADDNASGTAAALEIARLVARAPLRATLVVAMLDAEEVGLRGARAFVADPPLPLPPTTLAVNLDMVARSGGVLWAAGAHHTPALRPVLLELAADAPVALRLGHDRPGAPEGDDWTTASDHGPFHEAGYPFVYFGVEDHADYHRPSDDVERVDPGAFVASVRTVYAAIRALDHALPLEGTGSAR